MTSSPEEVSRLSVVVEVVAVNKVSPQDDVFTAQIADFKEGVLDLRSLLAALHLGLFLLNGGGCR